MKRRGFTVVELVITITIMGILITLAVVNLNSSQVNARDTERKSDVESLVANLEAYYNNTNPATTTGGGGYYPGTQMISNAANVRSLLPDIDLKVTRAPGVTDSAPISFVAATNNTVSTTAILPLPSSDNDVYVYQPLARDGSLCTTASSTNPACVKFTIYYYQESTGTVVMLASRHQ